MTQFPKDGLAASRQAPGRPELRAVEPADFPGPASLREPGHEPGPGTGPAGTRPADPGQDARPAAPGPEAEAPDAARRTGEAPAPALPRNKPKRSPARRPLPLPEAAAAAAAAPEVQPARMRPRHWGVLASFLLLVLLPFAATVGYLATRAADQFHSEVAFSVRSEEAASAAAGVLGALTQIGSGSASDSDILFEFIQSQEIVEEIDAELDLRAIFNRAQGDPVFTLGSDPSIEALLEHWNRMVDVSHDAASGIIHVRANAFTPADAQAIASAILIKSSALVNRLSDQAREDAIRFARAELDEAEANLRDMRGRLASFRRDNRIVDPTADVAGQMGLLNALQGQLAQTLVERDMLLSFADEGDQRVVQTNRRIDAITNRIEDERTSLGVTGAEEALADVIGTYEELRVDLEFANTAYTQALAGLAGARAEARRQSRYLAPHVEPTYPESALYPRRVLLAGLAGFFLLLGWGVVMLVYYNVRDNR